MYGWESHSYQREKCFLEALKMSFPCILSDQLKNKKTFSHVGGTFIYPHVFNILS